MITLAIARKLLALAGGEKIPASKLDNALINELVDEGIVLEYIAGRTKRSLYLGNHNALSNWLANRYGINNLGAYVQALQTSNSDKAALVQAAADSKVTPRRSFSGFLVNSCQPLHCTLGGAPFLVHPPAGTFQFISNYQAFVPPAAAVIAGVENAANFSHLERMRYLFPHLQVLFVCRYPQGQGRDLMRWLMQIPNRYLHLGDYDLAGINIYLSEYKKYLGDRASFFMPPGLEPLIEKYGNRKLYDQQQLHNLAVDEPELAALIALLHRHKKGLEQEALLIGHQMLQNAQSPSS